MSLTSRAKASAPPSLWRALKKGKHRSTRAIQGLFGLMGFNVDRKADFYSPLPVLSELTATKALWDKPSAMTGIDYDLAKLQSRYSSLLDKFGAELRELPSYSQCCKEGFGPGYPLVDGMTLYMMIRELKPARYLEVGSGLSTYYCSLAARKNQAEGRPVEIRCIEPYPFPALSRIPQIQINVKKVQEVPLEEFAKLEADDVLFIDSSHALKVGSDVAYLIMEVVPSLKPGVYIHIHDIPFPYNTPYPSDQTLFDRNWPLYFNEAMAVQAFLAFNPKYEIFMSCPLLRHFVPGFVEKAVSTAGGEKQTLGTYSSLWLRKLGS
jgi:hypothetical protein